MGTPTVKCPSCGGKNVIRKGTARLKYADAQVYLCKDCGKKFREQR